MFADSLPEQVNLEEKRQVTRSEFEFEFEFELEKTSHTQFALRIHCNVSISPFCSSCLTSLLKGKWLLKAGPQTKLEQYLVCISKVGVGNKLHRFN